MLMVKKLLLVIQGKRIKIIGQRVAEDWTNEERGFAA
jgi:hypothetical protein